MYFNRHRKSNYGEPPKPYENTPKTEPIVIPLYLETTKLYKPNIKENPSSKTPYFDDPKAFRTSYEGTQIPNIETVAKMYGTSHFRHACC